VGSKYKYFLFKYIQHGSFFVNNIMRNVTVKLIETDKQPKGHPKCMFLEVHRDHEVSRCKFLVRVTTSCQKKVLINIKLFLITCLKHSVSCLQGDNNKSYPQHYSLVVSSKLLFSLSSLSHSLVLGVTVGHSLFPAVN